MQYLSLLKIKKSDRLHGVNTAQEMKFAIKDFFSKCDQILFCVVKF